MSTVNCIPSANLRTIGNTPRIICLPWHSDVSDTKDPLFWWSHFLWHAISCADEMRQHLEIIDWNIADFKHQLDGISRLSAKEALKLEMPHARLEGLERYGQLQAEKAVLSLVLARYDFWRKAALIGVFIEDIHPKSPLAKAEGVWWNWRTLFDEMLVEHDLRAELKSSGLTTQDLIDALEMGDY